MEKLSDGSVLKDRDVAQMVERYIRDVEAARSNRVIPMNMEGQLQ